MILSTLINYKNTIIAVSLFFLISFSSASSLTSPTPFSNPNPQTQPDQRYFNYRLDAFKPSNEPLLTQTFGSTLRFETDAQRDFNSYNSHAVGFATNLPTIAQIQYGETASYGQTTTQSESYFYNHLFHLRDLKSGTTYHYKITVQDYDGNQISSPDFTFTTKTFTNETKITNQRLKDTAHQITKSGTYVLTEDIISDTLGVNVHSSNVIIDLNGYTIIYDNGTPSVIGNGRNDYTYNEQASFGIRGGLRNFNNISIYNGTIKQGKNNGTGFIGAGFNPICNCGSSITNVQGIIAERSGDSVGGMNVGGGNISHNVLYDRGSVIDDRHMQIKSLQAGDTAEVSYNSLRRFRQVGITGGKNIHHNETYSDSFVTNSVNVQGSSGATILDNKIFGIGYLPIGIRMGTKNVTIKNNFIRENCYAPYRRSDEYARNSAIAGMRATNWDEDWDNQLIESNTIIVKGFSGCDSAKGLRTSDNPTNGESGSIVFSGNLIKAEAMDGNHETGKAKNGYYNGDVNNAFTAISVGGAGRNLKTPSTTSDKQPISQIFINNHLLGNVNLVILGEGYHNGSNAKFYSTTLQKIDKNSEYFIPIRIGFWYRSTYNNQMLDNHWVGISPTEQEPFFFGGVGYDDMAYGNQKIATFIGEDNQPLINTDIKIGFSGSRLGYDFAKDPRNQKNVITILDENGNRIANQPVKVHYNGEIITVTPDGKYDTAIKLSDGTYPPVGAKVYREMPDRTETINIKTDSQGKSAFSLLLTKYLKAGNGLEKDGKAGAKTEINFTNYTFTAGTATTGLTLNDLQNTQIIYFGSGTSTSGDNNSGNNNSGGNNSGNNNTGNNNSGFTFQIDGKTVEQTNQCGRFKLELVPSPVIASEAKQSNPVFRVQYWYPSTSISVKRDKKSDGTYRNLVPTGQGIITAWYEDENGNLLTQVKSLTVSCG